MSTARRRRGWRFYRNWLLMALVWLALGLGVGLSFRSPWHLLWLIPLLYFGTVALKVYGLLHPRVRLAMFRVTPERANLRYEKVEFPSRDPLTLFGWYVPGHKRAAIALVHGAGASGITLLSHAAMLAEQGYGVLMFDMRAHGSSDGYLSTGGWCEVNDLLGAVDYLQSRHDVDPNQVGVLGISMGAQVALRAAAQSSAIRGVVAEGAVPAVLADEERPARWWGWFPYARQWLYYALRRFMSGARPPAGVVADISKISPRPLLLIAAGDEQETRWAQRFYAAAKDPKYIWLVPEAQHAQAYFARKEAYEAKCVALFETAFQDESASQRLSDSAIG